MTTTWKTGPACFVAVLLALPAPAVNRTVKPEDYSIISQRNPFGLVDPPPPPPVKEPEKPPVEVEPPPNVELTGIFHHALKAKTYALFLIQERNKPDKRSYMWSVDEGDDGIKVLSIDQDEAKVKLSVRGQETTITFSAPKQAPGLPGVPGVPPAVGMPAVPTAAAGGIQQFGGDAQTGQFRGGRSTRTAVGGAIPIPQQGAAGANPTLRPIPGRQLRTAPLGANSSRIINNQPSLTVREQEALIELQREADILTGQGQFTPPLPPTSLTRPEILQEIVVDPLQSQVPALPNQ